MNKLIVVGASGVNGRAATLHFAGLDKWEVMTLSRSQKPIFDKISHISVNLLDRDAIKKQADKLSGTTHIFYAALKPNEDAEVEANENAQMFANIIEAVENASDCFERLIFLQGGKIYGAHLGVYKTPARESDSRHFPPNLYFRHQDYATQHSKAQKWRWTALRPDIIIGHSIGSAMNLGNLIGVYATLCQELGVAMQFPGTLAAYEVLVNVTDADIVAQAAQWSIESDRDGAFNITNGDVFRWKHVWPKLVEYFGLEVGEPQPISLQSRLDAMSDVWNDIVKRESLEPNGVFDLGQGSFGDFIFHVEKDAIFDVTKARQAGFEVMTRRSEASFIQHFEQMRDRNLIPKS